MTTDFRALVDEFTDLLTVAPDGEDTFTGRTVHPANQNGRGRVFGGQVIGQALAAATATVPEDRPVHSLHAYFLRMGDDHQPIAYDVARDLDGGSFSNRRIVASQQGENGRRPILTMLASFQRREAGLAHTTPMPDVPRADDLLSNSVKHRDYSAMLPEYVRDVFFRDRAIDMRSVEKPWWAERQPTAAIANTWIRTNAPVSDDPRVHRAMLAYATDMTLMPTALRPHGKMGFSGDVHEASLDHAVWFHDDFRIDEWLLFRTESHWSDHGRGLITGKVWSADGRLVASVTQEGMMRLPKVKA